MNNKVSRSPENSWHDAIMGEIELGSMDAYMAMACDWDVGLSMMSLERMFQADDCYEKGLKVPTSGPWGPWGDEDYDV